MTTDEILRQRLQASHLVWVSSKATDAAPLLQLGRELSVVSIIGSGKELSPKIGSFSIEEETSKRYDYDRFSWDQLPIDQSVAIAEHIRTLAREREVIIVPFSASQMFSNLALSENNVQIAGNFFHIERAFNYKPWVEEELKKIGVPTVPWKHFTPGTSIPANMRIGNQLTRLAESSGGLGMKHSHSIDQLHQTLAYGSTVDIFSVADFFEETLPLNITGCVFPGGEVTVHPVSLQIIGPSVCTDREFGYCGNDFGSARPMLTDKSLEEIEGITLRVGRWLRTYNYIGVFGIDFLKVNDMILVSELNARFQASSHLGAGLMRQAGWIDAYADHLSAHVGLSPQEYRPNLKEITKTLRPRAQIFSYFIKPIQSAGPSPITSVDSTDTPHSVDLVPLAKNVQNHSLLFRLICDDIVLDKNGKLTNHWINCVLEQNHKIYDTLKQFQ